MGIVGREIASSAQLRGAETMIVGIGNSKMEAGNGSEGFIAGNRGLVCMDIVAEDDGKMIGGSDWMKTAAMVGLTWVPTSV